MAYFGGIGGGVSRDVLLNDIPSPIENWGYLLVCLAMGSLGMVMYRYAKSREERFRSRMLAYSKSFSLPWFAILGAHKALDHGLGIYSAIAIGLTFLYSETVCEAVVVMDADGQDRPQDVPELLRKFREENRRKIVFAARTRRSESVLFRLCYHGYRGLHRLLTGVSVRTGNFSILPFSSLASLSVVAELWNHYSAAVFRSRLPYTTIPAPRGNRTLGDPRMNFLQLVLHGLSALSVYAEVIGLRVLVAASVLLALDVGGLLVIVTRHRLGAGPEPSWLLLAGGILFLLLFEVIVVSGVLIFSMLSSRANLTFLPIRDFRYFVRDTEEVFCRPTDPE